MTSYPASLVALACLLAALCGCEGGDAARPVITFPASAVGKEAEVLRRQVERFQQQHPEIGVELRQTPDAADQRHQLYVQWLNARASQPDILQLDVIWTAEFAAAGWILPLDSFQPEVGAFFPSTIQANRWDGRLYALPWFVDVGMLYYRTDLLAEPPRSFADLTRLAEQARGDGVAYGYLWQGARYEGLVCVFLEVLGGFGGDIMDDQGRIVVDSEAAVQALTFLRDSIYQTGITPEAALTWQEEQTRFGFQNGQSAFLRNWPYAYPLMEDAKQSRVAGKFAVAPIPATPRGQSTSALGGSQLAINAHSRYPKEAYLLINFLTQPEQMLERAQLAGQNPTRRAVYQNPELAQALAIPPAKMVELIERAKPRPVTPVYTELSEILQIWLSRALTRQIEPRAALQQAARQMRELLVRVGLGPSS